MNPPDQLNFLTLDRTFCVFCFNQGKRPPEHQAGILAGVRFGRHDLMSGALMSQYRRKARGRVRRHLIEVHPAEYKANYPEAVLPWERKSY